VTTFDIGRKAEAAAADYLKSCGFNIIEQNWRTRWCEIDVVAKKTNIVFFIEVKYRQTAEQGLGLDYITPKKLKQMRFAADNWVCENDWKGDYQLAAVEVFGDEYIVTNFVENIF
jgi:uncharacterized protein (TIGR00252 family)